jgi:LDH2 family malate/lactate/ureidoglycolate dehydrogenase
MRMAMDKARQYGLGAVTVRNGTHFGIAGYYPLMAAKEGMMGFTVTNARPAVAPTFSTEPMLGTNPIAFAAPSDVDYPFCFDGATPIAQRGKIEVAARAEKPVPAGWVIDAQGNPMTDPVEILKDFGTATAALLPLGGAGEELAGHKGYGLGTMVEILSASLCGGVFMKDLLGFAPDGSRRPYMLGHFFLAIDVEHFIPLEVSRSITGQIMRALRASTWPVRRSTSRNRSSASRASPSTPTCAASCRSCGTNWAFLGTRATFSPNSSKPLGFSETPRVLGKLPGGNACPPSRCSN